MKKAIIRLATEKPRVVYAIVLAMVLVTAAMMVRLEIDTDPESMLAADQSDRVFHNKVEDRFVLHDAIVVGIVNNDHPDGVYNVETLTSLHSLTEQILAIDGVIEPDLMSLAVADNIGQEGPGTIRFEWMMRDAPTTEAQAKDIRDKVGRLPLLQDTLVSGDGRAAAIYVPIASKDLSYKISQEIIGLTESIATSDEFHVTGLPVAEDTFGHEMFLQMGISAPLAGLMIFLLMLYFFRSAPLVIAPMLVAMATVVVSMGLLIGLGFTVHIMSSMIPIFLMPIAVVDSVHIMSDFVDQYRPGDDAKEVVSEVVDHLYTPMLFTSLTSAVGFASLLLTPIPPVQVFGVFVAFGILLAFILTILLIPAYIVRLSPAALSHLLSGSKSGHTQTPLAHLLRRVGRFSMRRGKLITGLAVVLIAVSVAGISRIEINDNPVRWFKANHPIRVADAVLNEHFAGTYDAFFVLTHSDTNAKAEFVSNAEALLSDIEDPYASALKEQLANSGDSDFYGAIIATADDALFESESDASMSALESLIALAEDAQSASRYFQRPDVLAEIEAIQVALDDSGLVGKTNALPDVVKVVNRELRGGDAEHYAIPGSVPAVAQTLLQYQSSHRPQDLWHMVTPDFSSTAIWLQLTSGDNQDMTQVIDALDAHLAERPLPAGVEGRWAGKNLINVVWQDAMVKGMLLSLVGAFGAVFLMMTLLFRSVRLGLLAMVPLSVTILGVYGLIGWIGKDYDMPIAVLSSLTLGLSVDFAIHFIQRARAILQSTGSFETTYLEVFEEPARAIARNAIIIAIGFTPLFFAPLVPYITVGAFMAAIMALSGVTTLVLLPALMSWAGGWLFGRDLGQAGPAPDAAATA
ncbi:MAG: MMPL family transporter [Woeseiaceae bacterium]|nr:MMPL family transporter [Woeseiaceae bacterium]